MEKKLRITIPNEIYKIIESDLEDFGITKNFLCNYIFEKSDGFKQVYNYKYNGSKKIIQFNLNKRNLENYYSFLAEKNIEVEAEYFRNIFLYYAQQSKKSRELFIFKNTAEKIMYAIENRKKIIVTFADEIKKIISPYYMGSSELELKNYIFSYDEDESKFKNFTLRNIKSVYVTEKKTYDKEMEFVNKVIENFDPFLSYNKNVTVRFTDEGLRILKVIKTYRPKLLEQKGNICKFQCSELQGKRYFSCFWNEAEILEPEELRRWFKEKGEKTSNLYK
ncbi:WYL domain-containing protein [Fusobacterium perfoetens]|uniref:WYL domain-containing protein n=1 Tax=Fusobacterium perfoetens TaxID=852 RepID=UPI001F2EF9E7|nr:WYL domain-containing protein [Fusobacterium perfoetens]MCF2625811.1 WYL domain-containing protein [Fusobacterium perfoetens]